MHLWPRAPAGLTAARVALLLLGLACLALALSPPPASPGGKPAPQADTPGGEGEGRWFPRQVAPAALVRATNDERLAGPRLATEMMVQSVAGLAALAVNEGRCDEMVWVATGNADLERWYAGLLARRPPPEVRGALAPWDLVERYRRLGVVKGYILYRLDGSPGELNEHRRGMDLSVNVATSLAGLLGGVLVEESLEGEARRRGLELLLDARGKAQRWCFETYGARLNRRLMGIRGPRTPYVREIAMSPGRRRS